ncbi:tripartite motif-containing protein 60 [Dipodomys spectabilis]|uniref:tripartite motif-containing protein 60 n=1 Tax=Dipodomys spectabilis TaxID=105255 RepID=UPI001C53641B|nr:tripartite motif-containing protein 60 [Dipodomys spectabilis]
MEVRSGLAHLQEESCCPICLDYFKDPVTIDCGHNFCFDCLHMCWKDLQSGSADDFPCPVCRFHFARIHFKRNPQLRNLAEIAKQLQVRRSKRQQRLEERPMCQKHNQFLTFFCSRDMQVLCPLCSFSAEHQSHYVCSVKTIASYHRGLVKESLSNLQSDAERADKVVALQGTRSKELRAQVELRRDEINSEFEQVRWSFQVQQEALLKQMREEESSTLTELQKHLVTLSSQASTLLHLLKEVKDKQASSDLELLADVKSLHDRLHHRKSPELVSFQLKEYAFGLPPQYSSLDPIIKKFHIQVSFDPNTAHPYLVVSEDRKMVWYSQGRENSSRELCAAVLGLEKFVSGRHYWEVEVGNKARWTLGVCQNRLPRNWSNHTAVHKGVWAVGIGTEEEGYVAFGPRKTHIMTRVRPSKVGIFLDYELGEVFFYNMTDKSLLYSFSDSFTNPICSFFCPGVDPEPLKIVPLST